MASFTIYEPGDGTARVKRDGEILTTAQVVEILNTQRDTITAQREALAALNPSR